MFVCSCGRQCVAGPLTCITIEIVGLNINILRQKMENMFCVIAGIDFCSHFICSHEHTWLTRPFERTVSHFVIEMRTEVDVLLKFRGRRDRRLDRLNLRAIINTALKDVDREPKLKRFELVQRKQ